MSLGSQSECEKALKQFSEQLQCMICLKLPTNANICPFCSVLFCYGCVWQWLTRPLEEEADNPACCPHCRKDLQPTKLIKLHCFEQFEDLGPTLERISDCALAQPENDLNPDDVPKPKYTVGHFTLRKFVPKKGPQRVFSKEIVDNLGSVWKLEVWPKGCESENYWISVFLRLHKGLAGKYEYTIELLNDCPKKYTLINDFEVRSSCGVRNFIDTRTMSSNRNATNLNFRLFVRPASFEEQSKLQTNLLQQLKSSDEQLKGDPSCFTISMDNFSQRGKNGYFEECEDYLNNVWEMGVSRTNSSRYLQFYACLLQGFPGLYDFHLELTNHEEDCAKKLNFQHQFSKKSKAFFNMQIRFNQLEEFGFTHFEENCLEIIVSITPVKINLQSLQRYYSNDESDSDVENNSGDEMYYH
ncbi:uncharacterized protein LOC135709754 [Ochlerotatus camptorhynchus]|uniref:uncharacterized protein LOC135709754 n=1 Tax=Ochlerotatus camptorhynchus TaxID=644619 RepID=UPI0031D7CBD7